MQDKAFFTRFLSTISKSILPRVLSCKPAYEVWDKVHKHFKSQKKLCVHQLMSELKMSKKGIRTIFKYVLRVCAIDNSPMIIGGPIYEYVHVDAILHGLSEEYDPLIMMEYGKTKPIDIYDVEVILYVQEA